MGTPLLWFAFNLFVLLAIALDLGVFHRKAHKVGIREAAMWSALWIGLALGFGSFIWRCYGAQRGLEYFTGYVIEQALSVDNLFIFLVLFRTFRVDESVRHRVLEWGIIGALVMRGIMILTGAALVSRFGWILQIFGAFLVYTGLRLLLKRDKTVRFERNPFFRFASAHLPVTKDYRGDSFFVREAGKLIATPLVLVLLIVEITDVSFAVDSIPAIFGITRDAFIVFTSNVFAILGLRALYFLLANILDYLRYLSIGLALVLLFVGVKMVLDPWWHISVSLSLVVVAGILVATTLLSILVGPRKDGTPLQA